MRRAVEEKEEKTKKDNSGAASKKIKDLKLTKLVHDMGKQKSKNLFHDESRRIHLKIIVEIFLKFNADDMLLGCTCFNKLLLIATKNNQKYMANLLMKYGADVNAEVSLKNLEFDFTPVRTIYYAITNVDVEMIKLFLKYGANLKNDPEYLIEAVKTDKKDIVEIVLEHTPNIDVNLQDKYKLTALHYINYRFDKMDEVTEIVELLLKKGANVNAKDQYGETPLFLAIRMQNVKLVETFLKHNADVNAKNSRNNTPLHFSAIYGNVIINRMLLNKGANINSKRYDGKTPLHIAAEFKCRTIYDDKNCRTLVKVLLERGADVNSKTTCDETPLHLAVQGDNLKITKMLIKFGANINSRTTEGKTALHIACIKKNPDTVKLLLEYGCNINITDIIGYTAINYAQKWSFNDKYFSSSYIYEHYIRMNNGAGRVPTILKILGDHLVKIKAANFFVSEKNLKVICNDAARNFGNKCEQEITRMRNERIENTCISYFDILTKNLQAMYVRNEKVIQALKTNYCEIKFPIYVNMMRKHFWMGEIRRELLDKSSIFFNHVFNSSPKLHDCTGEIVKYLSNDDLRTLIDVCKRNAIVNDG